MGSQRAGRGLKSFLEALRFILAEFEPKPSRFVAKTGLGTYDMCCVETEDMCRVEKEDMCCVASPDMCCFFLPRE